MLIDELDLMVKKEENNEIPEDPRISELEHRLTLLTIAHEELRHRVEKMERKNKPVERVW